LDNKITKTLYVLQSKDNNINLFFDSISSLARFFYFNNLLANDLLKIKTYLNKTLSYKFYFYFNDFKITKLKVELEKINKKTHKKIIGKSKNNNEILEFKTISEAAKYIYDQEKAFSNKFNLVNNLSLNMIRYHIKKSIENETFVMNYKWFLFNEPEEKDLYLISLLNTKNIIEIKVFFNFIEATKYVLKNLFKTLSFYGVLNKLIKATKENKSNFVLFNEYWQVNYIYSLNTDKENYLIKNLINSKYNYTIKGDIISYDELNNKFNIVQNQS
jgi:hypothetical protein